MWRTLGSWLLSTTNLRFVVCLPNCFISFQVQYVSYVRWFCKLLVLTSLGWLSWTVLRFLSLFMMEKVKPLCIGSNLPSLQTKSLFSRDSSGQIWWFNPPSIDLVVQNTMQEESLELDHDLTEFWDENMKVRDFPELANLLEELGFLWCDMPWLAIYRSGLMGLMSVRTLKVRGLEMFTNLRFVRSSLQAMNPRFVGQGSWTSPLRTLSGHILDWILANLGLGLAFRVGWNPKFLGCHIYENSTSGR